MRIAIRTWFALGVAAWCSLAGCNDSHQSAFDKNTNWLRSCIQSDQCGSGTHCMCGVCTSVCDRDAECRGLGEDAVCTVLPVSTSCTTADEGGEHVCSRACERNADCAGDNARLACVHGACVPAKPAAQGSDNDPKAAGASTLDAGPPTRAGGARFVELDLADPTDITGCGGAFICEAVAQAGPSLKDLLAGSDGYLYWADWGTLDSLGNYRNDGTVWRLAKDSVIAEKLWTDLDRPWRLWQSDTRLYWLSGDPIDFDNGTGSQTIYVDGTTSGGKPVALKTNTFERVQMHRGRFVWQSPTTIDGTVPKAGISLQLFSAEAPLQQWSELSVAGYYAISGMDDQAVYVEDGGTSILLLSFDGAPPQELVDDPPVSHASVAEEALWVIRTGSDGRNWVASMPKTGGELRNVGAADDYIAAPRAGASVVWLVTRDPSGTTQYLWSIPKSGGMRELAFTWTTNGGSSPTGISPPIWAPDGDDAWVFGPGYGNVAIGSSSTARNLIVHIHR